MWILTVCDMKKRESWREQMGAVKAATSLARKQKVPEEVERYAQWRQRIRKVNGGTVQQMWQVVPDQIGNIEVQHG